MPPRVERSAIIKSTCFNGRKICLKCGKTHIYQKSVGFMRNLSEEMPESQPHSVSPLTLQQWLLITRNTMKKTLNCVITSLNTQLASQGQWQHIMTTQSSNCGQKGAWLTCSSPSLLPGSLSPTSLFFLMSCQGPGPPRTWWGKGGGGVKTPKCDWDRGGLERTNYALWHTDLRTAVPLNRTVIT